MSVTPEIKGYRIERMVGKGGMSEVYLAYQDKRPDIPMAVKIMKGVFVGDDNFYKRFEKEIKVLRLLEHPNIIKCYDSGKYDDIIYLVMEYLPDPDLKKRITAGDLSMQNVVRWLREIAAALDYSHTRNFIHRDIKPENVLIRSDGSTALADFGIARSATSHTKMTGTGMSIGTPYYMSPEQARGRAVDYRSDIYSFGVMVYEVLTGKVPYKSEDSLAIGIMHITNPIPTLPEKYQAWQPLLDMMMAKKPEQRYQSFNEFIVDLDRIVKNQTTLAATIHPTSVHTEQEVASVHGQATPTVPKTIPQHQVTQQAAPPPQSRSASNRTTSRTARHSLTNEHVPTLRMQPYAKKKRVFFMLFIAVCTSGGYYANERFRLLDEFIPPALTTEQQKQQTSALQQARSAIQKGILFPPARRNAYDALVKVAQLTPKNGALWNLAYDIVRKSEEPLSKEQAELLEGLYTSVIDRHLFTQQIEKRYIVAMNLLAQQAYQAKRYISPAEYNALYYTNAVLYYDSTNAVAITQRERVQQVIYRQARQMAKKQPARARNLLQTLLAQDGASQSTLVALAEVDRLSGTSDTQSTGKTPAPEVNAPTGNRTTAEPRVTPPTTRTQPRSSTPTPTPKLIPQTPKSSGKTTTPSVNPPTSSQPSVVRGSAPTRQDINRIINALVKNMVYIEGGSFVMGNTTEDAAANPNAYTKELPVQTVFVNGFYMMSREVTFRQYDTFAHATNRALPKDNGWGRGDRPVINVSNQDAQAFARWLSQNSKYRFSLPSESQWEYAARGGTESNYYWSNQLRQGRAQCANCGSLEAYKTVAVGSYQPNPYGLYDMLGNVWEWTADCWNTTLSGKPSNGQPSKNGNCRQRVLKGGSWYDYGDSLRISNRVANDVNNRSRFDGFRLVRR